MITKNNGFSLVEILVAISALGIVTVGIMSLSNIQSNTLQGSKATEELGKTISSINAILNSPKACETSFNGVQINIDQEVTTLVNENGDDIFTKSMKIESGVYEIATMIVKNTDPKFNKVDFEVTFNRIKKANSPKEFVAKFSIPANINAGVIVNCNKDLDAMAQGILEKMCLDLDPTGQGICDYENILNSIKKSYCTDAARPWLKWIPDASDPYGLKGQCLLNDAGKECDASRLVQGFNNEVDPTLRCRRPPS